MTSELWMAVLTAASLGAAVLSAVYAARASSVSREIAEADLATDIAVTSSPAATDAPEWVWMITNVSRTGIVRVRVRYADCEGELEPKHGYRSIVRPSCREFEKQGGIGLNWGADALNPFETGYFHLPIEAAPDEGEHSFLRVSWTEIRATPKPRERLFRIMHKGLDEFGRSRYKLQEVDTTGKIGAT